MRLLMISGDRSILSGKKGAFRYTLEELSKNFERIDVICPAPSPSPSPGLCGAAGGGEMNFFGNVHFHPSPRGLWYQPFWIKKCGKKLLDEFHHDSITVHEYPPFYNGIGARLLLDKPKTSNQKPKTILEIHHIVGWPKAASLSEKIGYWLSKLFLVSHSKKFDAVRVVSKIVAEKLAAIGVGEEKIRIVPSFYLDSSHLKPDSSIQKKYDLVFCGRLVKNKGLPVLLEALKNIPEKKLLIIGDGPERNYSEKLVVSLGLTHRVTFLGWLADQDGVIGELQSARAFVLPSLSEGGPRIALAAMAIGLPVIATRVGVLPEVIEDETNGIFFDGTSGDLKSKIEDLLKNEEKMRSIGETAKAILTKFDKKRLIKDYAEYLKGCVNC